MIERLAGKKKFFLLAVSGLIHLAISLTLHFLGNNNYFPSLVSKGGIFTSDAQLYVRKCSILCRSLLAGDWHFLIARGEQIHVRLYTLSYTALSPLFGDSVLSYELVNFPLFLLAVFIIYKIGKICFSEPVGLWAGSLFLLFPTLIAHFSQPLRDALAICLFLLFFLLLAKILKETLDLRKALLSFAGTSTVFLLMWLTRENMLPIYIGVIALTCCLYALWNFRQLKDKKYNFLLLAALSSVCLLAPVYLARLLPSPDIFPAVTTADFEKLQQAAVKIREYQDFLNEKEIPDYLEKLNMTRHKFLLFYRDAGANIDDDVLFRSPSDVVWYAPRAVQIGLFSPFPEMWVETGKGVGRAGRIISGAETLASYILMIFALAALIKFRRSIFAWQIFLTVILAAFVLGTGVVNLGALYRLRYVFWCLLMVLAAQGICLLADAAKARKINVEDAA